MEVDLKIKLNEKLFLKDPQDSELGRKIIKIGLQEINKLGFELFTFRKLAAEIGTTEASIYRYFENKHKMLIYLFGWYWSQLEYRILFEINNLSKPELKLKKILDVITQPYNSIGSNSIIDEKKLYELIIWEGSKAYLTRHVGVDNKEKLFKPYKDMCALFAKVIHEYNPNFKYPKALASSIVELAHTQKFFMQNLPSLNDFSSPIDEKSYRNFIELLLFDLIKKK